MCEGRDGAGQSHQTCPPSQKSRRSEMNELLVKRLFAHFDSIKPSVCPYIHHWSLWNILPKHFLLKLRLRFELLLYWEPETCKLTSIFPLSHNQKRQHSWNIYHIPFFFYFKFWHYVLSVPLRTPLEPLEELIFKKRILCALPVISRWGKKTRKT